jgi:hypothetical protein
MKKVAISFTLILSVCLHFSALPQHDSTRLDAAYLSLKKEFTQSITIKGTDLEKMPFTDLSLAIDAWLYGAYTYPGTIAYVVDGNPVGDVNAYSIHDIDEVVLVQNAVTLVGAGNAQELVLITTKRGGKGRFGLEAAAQAGLVNADYSNQGLGSSHTGLYHDYFIRAYENLSTIRFGLSANFQRDIWPSPNNGDLHVITPYNLQRWRLNGFLSWQPDAHNRIDVLANYSPQTMDYSSLMQTATSYYSNTDGHQHLIVPQLRWHSDLGNGWTNDLLGTYLTDRQNINARSGDTGSVFTIPVGSGITLDNATTSTEHFYVRDRLAYAAVAGNWMIQPALNASYEHIKETQDASEIDYVNFGAAGTSTSSLKSMAKVWFLTPSIDLSLGHLLDIHAGAVYNASYSSVHGFPRWFPFAGLSLDLLRLSDADSRSGQSFNGRISSSLLRPSLKVFGSYARRTTMSVDDYGLTNLLSGMGFFAPPPFSAFFGSQLYPINAGATIQGTAIPTYWVWETGLTFSMAEDRLQVSYNFERLNSLSFVYIINTGNGPVYIEPQMKTSIHHLGIMAKVVDGPGFSWRSGLNATVIRNSPGSSSTRYLITEGDYPGTPVSWKGGWVNRIGFKDLSFGLDLLYHFNELPAGNAVGASKINSILLQNIYAGYHWRLSHSHSLGLFLESRGLFRSHSSDLPDQRRYYTIGGTWSL